MESQTHGSPDFNKKPVRVQKWPHFHGALPKYETAGASGFDIRAQLTEPVVLQPCQRVLIPTGLSFEIPMGFELQARPRSGWAIKQGISLVNTPGTIDADYRGEVKVIIINHGQEAVTVNDQDRICQLVLCPVYQCAFEEVDSLSETLRGAGGFGSTGTSGNRTVQV